MVDQHGDRFGFMYLKIPAQKVAKGKPLKIKVTGGKFDKTSWYMTFKFQLETRLSLKSLPAISEINGQKKQLGVVGVLHFEKPAPAKIYIDNKLANETELQFGYNYLRVELPEVKQDKTVSYRLEVSVLQKKAKLP
jgi:alpha-mannosidase